MLYKTIVITPASIEPVTVAEAKEQLRLEATFTLDDSFIGTLISAARERVESYCNRFFTEQIIKIVYEGNFPAEEVILPYTDLVNVDSITYSNSEAVSNPVPSADYTVDLDGQRIVGSWPSDADNYTVVVNTGAPEDIESIKQAILMLVSDMYELRSENIVAGTINTNPAVQHLLYHKRNNLGIR